MPPTSSKKSFAVLRIIFGIVWLVDACFKWSPAFLNSLPGYLATALAGQPPFVVWWITLWINIININPHLFALLVALIETFLALALIFGFFTRTAIVLGVALSIIIWTTAEGFGGPYASGSTDIGCAIIYALFFIALWCGECWQYYSLEALFKKKSV